MHSDKQLGMAYERDGERGVDTGVEVGKQNGTSFETTVAATNAVVCAANTQGALKPWSLPDRSKHKVKLIYTYTLLCFSLVKRQRMRSTCPVLELDDLSPRHLFLPV